MRDIFFDEVETDDPAAYVQQVLKGRGEGLVCDAGLGGQVTIYVACDGLNQKFVFTPL